MSAVTSSPRIWEIVLSGGPCSGKCVRADTSVIVDGVPVEIEQLWRDRCTKTPDGRDREGYWYDLRGFPMVISVDANRRLVSAIATRLYRQKVRETGRRITLQNGSALVMTNAHRVLTPDGWSSTITVGDLVAVPRHLPHNGNWVDPDLVKLMAWQVTEGCEEPSGVCITQKKTDVLYEVRAAATRVGQRLGIEFNTMPVKRYGSRCPVLAINSRGWRAWLNANGYRWGERSATKALPAWLIAADDKTVRHLLREMFSAEASVGRGDGHKTNIEYSTASRQLAEQVRILLLRFGIQTTLCEKPKMATNGKRIMRTYWSLLLNSDATRLFNQLIGFSCETKQATLTATAQRKQRGSRYGIQVNDLLLEARRITELGRHWLGVTSAYMCGERRYMSASKATALLEHFDRILDGDAQREYKERISALVGNAGRRYVKHNLERFGAMDYVALRCVRNLLNERIHGDLLFVEVKSVEQVALDEWVYDLEVPGACNYVAAGIVTHNTSSLARLTETLEDHGLRVLVVPEIATMLVSGGLSDLAPMARTHPQRFYAVEEQMLLMLRDLRARYRALARTLEQDTVILFDRAEMDCCAYLGRELFEQLLARNDLGYAEVRDSYDRVIHLVSTAVDAPEHYSTANNAARSETASEAVSADRRCLEAWTGAHLSIIDNSTDFEGKLHRVTLAVLQTVGLPAPLEIERKFLLVDAPNLTVEPLCSAQLFEITQTYLRSDDPGVERRLRLRAHAGQETHIYTEKRPSGADRSVREEVEARISRSEYRRLLVEADSSRQPIRKQRRVFVSDHQVFELDSYTDRNLHILEIELHDPAEQVRLPAGLPVLREVTGEPAYSNHALAARP